MTQALSIKKAQTSETGLGFFAGRLMGAKPISRKTVLLDSSASSFGLGLGFVSLALEVSSLGFSGLGFCSFGFGFLGGSVFFAAAHGASQSVTSHGASHSADSGASDGAHHAGATSSGSCSGGRSSSCCWSGGRWGCCCRSCWLGSGAGSWSRCSGGLGRCATRGLAATHALGVSQRRQGQRGNGQSNNGNGGRKRSLHGNFSNHEEFIHGDCNQDGCSHATGALALMLCIWGWSVIFQAAGCAAMLRCAKCNPARAWRTRCYEEIWEPRQSL